MSTEYDRIQAVTSGRSRYFCKICDTNHNSGTPTTRNLLVTSSTLINFWKDRQWYTPVHFDCEAIVGGTVGDGIRAFEVLYESNPTPMNVVIAIGINDILKNRSVHDTVQDLYTFTQKIRNHSKRYKHVELGLEGNSVVILPLIRPPKCVKLNREYDPPTPDKSTEINQVNSEIGKINVMGGGRIPVYLNTLGIRNDRNGKPSHRSNEWREDEYSHKLHLISSIKCYAARKISKYFEQCA